MIYNRFVAYDTHAQTWPHITSYSVRDRDVDSQHVYVTHGEALREKSLPCINCMTVSLSGHSGERDSLAG